jgi:hypothetical protein
MLRRAGSRRGQAFVELALVLPLAIMLLVGIITIGLGVFYQQQLANAAREGARYAAIHSATALRPTVSDFDPLGGTYGAYQPLTYKRADPPPNWPFMTAHARSKLFGLNPADVVVTACWSGYRDVATDAYDAPPDGTTDILGNAYDTYWAQCTIDGVDPTADPSSIGCSPGMVRTDEASAMSEGPGVLIGNRVTVYACYLWQPPLAGLILIPSQVTLRAVVTEPIQRQQ